MEDNIQNNDKPIMRALLSNTIRGIVKQTNELNIKKEDIISLFKEINQFVLIYYK